jgi:hypothetical protein
MGILGQSTWPTTSTLNRRRPQENYGFRLIGSQSTLFSRSIAVVVAYRPVSGLPTNRELIGISWFLGTDPRDEPVTSVPPHTGTRPARSYWLRIGFAERHAAAIRQTVVTIEKTMGIIKKNFQLKSVIAAKQRANAQAVPRMSAKNSGRRPPSCQANTTASRRNTLTKSPNPT